MIFYKIPRSRETIFCPIIMSTKDPLSVIKEAEKQAADLIVEAKQEVESNIKAAEAEGRARLEQIESEIISDLQVIEDNAIAALKERKSKIAKETDQTIKKLCSQAEPRQAKAVDAVVKEILA